MSAGTPETILFAHERLDVYALTLEFMVVAHRVLDALPPRSKLADELERAAISIVLNTAEGSGEFRPKEKARFYRMALRSAAECAAILDVGRLTGAISEPDRASGREALHRVVAMLTKLAQRHDRS